MTRPAGAGNRSSVKLHPYNRSIIVGRWQIPYSPAYGWVDWAVQQIGRLLPKGYGTVHVYDLGPTQTAARISGLDGREIGILGVHAPAISERAMSVGELCPKCGKPWRSPACWQQHDHTHLPSPLPADDGSTVCDLCWRPLTPARED